MKVHSKKCGEGLETCPTLSESKEEQLYQSWNNNFSLPHTEREGINMDYMNSWNSLIKERLLCNMAKNPSRQHKQETKKHQQSSHQELNYHKKPN